MFGSGGITFNPESDIPDLSGKVILVTGSNTGLGKETILHLAKHGPKQIYLAARTQSKAETAIEEIKREVPDACIRFLQIDLMSFESIKAAAEIVNGETTRLDILINNAGIMATEPGFTTEGYEKQFGTNHMGHALFTKLLMPTLLATAKEANSDVRIINLSSIAHNAAPSGGIIFDQEKLNSTNKWTRYGNSKLANILFARGLAKRHPEITTVSVHPGVILTNLYTSVSNSGFMYKVGMPIFKFIYPSSDIHDGAKNQLWAATTKKENLVNGAYYTPVGNKSDGSNYAHDDKLADALWEYTEKELAAKGFEGPI